jgi:two-component system sensor histidine kinase/response regulator
MSCKGMIGVGRGRADSLCMGSRIVRVLWDLAARLGHDDATRRKVEEELRRRSRFFELSRDLLCSADSDGHFKQLNAAWTETLGWSEAELRSRPFMEFVHPDDRAVTDQLFAELAEGVVEADLLNRFATENGGWRWMNWKATADDGLIYASGRDVTERKAAEAALESSERRARQILEASERQNRRVLETAHDAFISTDTDGLITEWNPQAEASFGWSREEVLGRELAATVIRERDRVAHRHVMERFLATGQEWVLGKRRELTALHRDGREFPIELTISPLETQYGYSFHAFLRDITERERAQQELALARDQALEASRMKSVFVANVSHEIRTPMNGVIGMSELLLDTELDDEQYEFAETISSSGDALLEVIDGILDFSKIEAGKVDLDPTDFGLRDAIERACVMLAARAHKKGLELVVAIDAQVPALVRGDAARLRQVIANLVSNAIKFTAEGEVVVRATSSPANEGAALVRLEVSDTGIGIGPEALEQLFKPFSQADGSTTRKYGGTGLGLAISRQLIELMGGRVGAESEPGKGSSFWFELALARAEGGDGPPEEERELAGLRVLVIDDNETSRRLLERQLSSWQMICELADSAAHAIEKLESATSAGTPYALALLDLNMPDVDGYELARAIRAQTALRGIRLVLLTPAGGRSDAPEDVKLDGLLTKPVRESRLYEEIQAVMAGERPSAQRIHTPAYDTGARWRGAGPAVLVVEDTPVNQAVAAHMLKKCGYRAEIAENGRKALEALSKGSYAAVLMDCQMPELDGYETTRYVRRRVLGGQRIPIIAMTANSMQGERERCLAAGMDDYLTKPLRFRALKGALARWVWEPPVGSTGCDPALLTSAARAGQRRTPELLHEAVIGGLEHLEGDVFADLLAVYFDEAARQMSELTDAIGRGETLTVGQTAHKLGGSSGTLGAKRVSQIASELEATANAGDLTTADDLLDRLRGAFGDTKKAFRTRMVETSKNGSTR